MHGFSETMIMKGFTPREDWMKLPFMTQTPYCMGHTDRGFRGHPVCISTFICSYMNVFVHQNFLIIFGHMYVRKLSYLLGSNENFFSVAFTQCNILISLTISSYMAECAET